MPHTLRTADDPRGRRPFRGRPGAKRIGPGRSTGPPRRRRDRWTRGWRPRRRSCGPAGCGRPPPGSRKTRRATSCGTAWWCRRTPGSIPTSPRGPSVRAYASPFGSFTWATDFTPGREEMGPSARPSSAWRTIPIDWRNSCIRTRYRPKQSPVVSTGTSKRNSPYAAYGSARRMSWAMPEPRSSGPETPTSCASSRLMTPIPWVRTRKIVLPSSIASYSPRRPSTWASVSRQRSAHPAGRS